MLAVVSPFVNRKDERQGETDGFAVDFPDFSDETLLDSIDFDDLFVGMDESDVLPDLEVDPEIFAEFSDLSNNDKSCIPSEKQEGGSRKDEEDNASGSGFGSGSNMTQGEEIISKRNEIVVYNPSRKEYEGRRKSSSNSKNSLGKRKVKVDWTPELHRRFVQAVEQLGVDKAVPSRILELMGIDCLTRHNIASHLQKYRSHRKHLLAREAEAASWNQRRQIYGTTTTTTTTTGGRSKRDTLSPWFPPPTMGFPPHPMTPFPHFRPLHVWGHPSAERPPRGIWPKHIAALPPSIPLPMPPQAWPLVTPHSRLPPANPSIWHLDQRVPNPPPQVAPYLPVPPTRFISPQVLVPGIPPPHPLYKLNSSIGVPTAPSGQSCQTPQFDFHPSKESIDAAIGDILSKPGQPLPLGLRPPALDSVMTELQRQGIRKIPPTCM